MEYLENYLGNLSFDEKVCAKIVEKCSTLYELNCWLHNLDLQAELCESSSSYAIAKNKMIEDENKQILTGLTKKIIYIVSHKQINLDALITYCQKVCDILGNQIDIVELDENDRNNAYKIYLIADTVLKNVNLLKTQQKNSITL